MPFAALLAENSLFHAVGQIFHPLFVLIADVLAYIYSVVPTYGVAIIILTLLIMLVMTPLTIKSTRSMVAMQALQPEMQKLRAQFKGPENRQQLNEAMMALYREHGVSPTGGCLPMFLQMPAFIVLYDVIEGLANTVKRGAHMGTGKLICHQLVCATPRYVPHTSAIYKNLIKTPGVMHSMGLNLASRPLSHRANILDYAPYIGLLAIAVALQYFQMAQVTRRNKKSGQPAPQMPKQMQKMQRFTPLLFAYIYFLVPEGVVIYMIISSAIRVLTQDVMFRYGLVEMPGSERRSKAKAKLEAIEARASEKGSPAQTAAGSAQDGGGRSLSARAMAGLGSGRKPQSGARNGTTSKAQARSNGRTRGTTNTTPVSAPKAHPRSKSKRARKAR